MDITNPDQISRAPERERPEETTLEQSAKSVSKMGLSPEIKAFLHRMAENLRTHDPDVPKGRYRPY